MIISVSRRTDIPAFYAEWFRNRLREGFALVRNPIVPSRIRRIDLTPANIDGIVFWSKNPRPLLPYLDEVADRGIPFYFQYTLNPYGAPCEPAVPPLAERLETFAVLAERFGRERLVWRYDPVIFSGAFTPAYHEEWFGRIAEALAPHAGKCFLSFLDFYRKTKRNSAGFGFFDPANAEKFELASRLASIAAGFGIRIESCAAAFDLAAAGIERGRCVDPALFQRLFKFVKDRSQRPGCGCAASADLGAYDSCPHGCCYCYANASPRLANERFGRHDPASPLLFE